MSVKDLVALTCRSNRTITRHLERLTIYGLAEQKPNGKWVAFERSLDELATELGTKGMGEGQAERHRIEREAFGLFVEHQRAREMELQHQADRIDVELIEAGYVRSGGLLVAPWALGKVSRSKSIKRSDAL